MSYRLFVLAALLAAACPATATVLTPVPLFDTSGNDSGWDAYLYDAAHTGVTVDAVGGGVAYIRLEIAKSFTQPPVGSAFPTNVIQFVQRNDDAHTAPVILITDEAIINQTGLDWTDYHWQISGNGAFDKTATDGSGFSIAPFTLKAWGSPPSGWSSGYADSLALSGGTVPNGGSFFPGNAAGILYLTADLSGDGPATLTLTQYPTPEPASLALILGGATALVFRRRK